MNFRKGKGREDPEINLIAFIDVLLVILIFLMVTTTYSKSTALQITLPMAEAEAVAERAPEINVEVDAQGRYAINNVQVSYRDVAGLATELTEAANKFGPSRKDPIVIVNADALAAHQTVINVLEAARLAGMAQITFAAQSAANK